MSILVRLLKANGEVPTKDSRVAIGNNFLDLLWRDSQIQLNNTPVNSSSNYHYIKSAIVKLTTLSKDERSCQHSAGYVYEDTTFPNTPNSPSYVTREKIFRNMVDGVFPEKTERFVGYIYSDLKSLQCGIPPGIEVKITFNPNNPEILIDSYDALPQYKIHIDEVKLHVPVAQLAPSVFNNYMTHLPKEVATMAFKRLVVTVLRCEIFGLWLLGPTRAVGPPTSYARAADLVRTSLRGRRPCRKTEKKEKKLVKSKEERKTKYFPNECTIGDYKF